GAAGSPVPGRQDRAPAGGGEAAAALRRGAQGRPPPRRERVPDTAGAGARRGRDRGRGRKRSSRREAEAQLAGQAVRVRRGTGSLGGSRARRIRPPRGEHPARRRGEAGAGHLRGSGSSGAPAAPGREPTASIETGAARNARVPTDLALAYAATAPAAIPEPPPRAQPMGSLEAPAPVAAPAPAPRATVKAGGEPIRDPWLRGIV